jgi:hypothetical protein
MHNASPDYFAGQELITAEMLAEIDALSDAAARSENFEQVDLLAEEASVAGVFTLLN